MLYQYTNTYVNDTTNKNIRANPLRPPLKWAGGKRWLVPDLLPIWEAHQHRRLVEPFCGGLAVALGLEPERALLNDMNPHLVNFYRHLQHGLMIDKIEMANDATLYYKHRSRFNWLIHQKRHTTDEAAMLFYYLNRNGYNGLCRFNKRGFYNVPFGKYKTVHYTVDFSEYVDTLSRWELSALYFCEVPLHPDDFVYADPPYDVEFRQYSQDGFSWEDQERLAEWLSTHPGPVIISNQATERVNKLYGRFGYRLEFRNAPRRISRNGDRTPAVEVLAMRNC